MIKAAVALLIALCLGIPSQAQQPSGQNPTPLPQESSPGAWSQATAKAASEHHQSGLLNILSDTQGVDFGPYLSGIFPKIRENWYSLIPHEAEMSKGKLAIEFKILRSGQVSDMKLTASAGSSLDRPAWASIMSSNPFPALPDAFHGPYLALRIHYYYNPDKSDLEDAPTPVVGALGPITPIQDAILIQSTADSHPIKYPKKALHEKTDGTVRLVVRIAPDGGVESVATVEGNALLGDAASQAIRQWRFQPARESGNSVAERMRFRVEFRSEGPLIRFALFPWASEEHSSESIAARFPFVNII